MPTRVSGALPPETRVSLAQVSSTGAKATSSPTQAPPSRSHRTRARPHRAPILEGMRTKKKVDLERLAAALTDYPFAYLITVDEGYRVPPVTGEPKTDDLPD